jgi:hypothetical protein
MGRISILIEKHVRFVNDIGRSDDQTAFKGVHIPDTDRLVPRTSDDFVPVKVSGGTSK